MDSFRSLLGIPTTNTGTPPRGVAKNNGAIIARAEARQKGVSVQEQWQQQVHASEMKLKVNQARIQKAEHDKMNATNKSAFDVAARELSIAQEETKLILLKLNNQRAQLKLHQDAESNIDMAVAMRAGAEELSAATAVMEDLKVDDTMDTLREAADQVNEHSRILSEPIVSAPLGQPHASDVDDEWQQLLAQRRLQGEQPTVVTGAPPPATVAPQTKPRVGEKEMK